MSTVASPQDARLRSLSRLGRRILADAANAWTVSQRTILAMWAVPFLIALAGVVSGLISKEAYKWFTGEDRFAETMQVVFYSLALVLCIVVTRRLWQGGDKGIALLYLGLVLGFVFMVGEELNWGQRIFGWGTPESFAAINKQEETNLHNIYGVGTTFKWIQFLVGAYGTILPLLVWRWQVPERFRKLSVAVIPHYTLVPYFILLFVWRFYRTVLELVLGSPEEYYFAIAEYNEVMELVLAVGFLLFMIFQLRRLKARNW